MRFIVHVDYEVRARLDTRLDKPLVDMWSRRMNRQIQWAGFRTEGFEMVLDLWAHQLPDLAGLLDVLTTRNWGRSLGGERTGECVVRDGVMPKVLIEARGVPVHILMWLLAGHPERMSLMGPVHEVIQQARPLPWSLEMLTYRGWTESVRCMCGDEGVEEVMAGLRVGTLGNGNLRAVEWTDVHGAPTEGEYVGRALVWSNPSVRRRLAPVESGERWVWDLEGEEQPPSVEPGEDVPMVGLPVMVQTDW